MGEWDVGEVGRTVLMGLIDWEGRGGTLHM